MINTFQQIFVDGQTQLQDLQHSCQEANAIQVNIFKDAVEIHFFLCITAICSESKAFYFTILRVSDSSYLTLSFSLTIDLISVNC